MSILGNNTRGLSTNRAHKVGCTDWRQYSMYRSRKQLWLSLLSRYVKNLPKIVWLFDCFKLFKFLKDTNRKELNILKNDVTMQWLLSFVAMTSLQWWCCNNFAAVIFASVVSECLQIKLPYFLKLDSHLSKKFLFICFNESWKWWKMP